MEQEPEEQPPQIALIGLYVCPHDNVYQQRSLGSSRVIEMCERCGRVVREFDDPNESNRQYEEWIKQNRRP